jgi:hydrogenase maturation protease
MTRTELPPAAEGPAVVIGYGNALRGDDGAGPQVADAVARWGLPGVQALAVHQLTPELAEVLAAARVVVLVDAQSAPAGGTVEVSRLGPSGTASVLGHASDPAGLLALTHAVYGRCPPAWWVTVPAVDFGLGEGLSPTAQHGVAEALRVVARLIGGAARVGTRGGTARGTGAAPPDGILP